MRVLYLCSVVEDIQTRHCSFPGSIQLFTKPSELDMRGLPSRVSRRRVARWSRIAVTCILIWQVVPQSRQPLSK